MWNDNSVWVTHEGRRIRLKDLTDMHLANVIHYKAKCGHDLETPFLITFLYRMAKQRGLSKVFLGRAPYPFKDTSNRWKIWTDKKGFRILQQ